MVLWHFAALRISLPWTAMARAQKLRVRACPTIASSRAPTFFMARATEPILPDPRGRTMITLTLESMGSGNRQQLNHARCDMQQITAGESSKRFPQLMPKDYYLVPSWRQMDTDGFSE